MSDAPKKDKAAEGYVDSLLDDESDELEKTLRRPAPVTDRPVSDENSFSGSLGSQDPFDSGEFSAVDLRLDEPTEAKKGPLGLAGSEALKNQTKTADLRNLTLGRSALAPPPVTPPAVVPRPNATVASGPAAPPMRFSGPKPTAPKASVGGQGPSALSPLSIESQGLEAPSFQPVVSTNAPPPPPRPMSVGPDSRSQSADAGLKGVEALRLAQNRLSEMEVELNRLRTDNNHLVSVAETYKRQNEELRNSTQKLEILNAELRKDRDQDRDLVKSQSAAKDRELHEARTKIQELEIRVDASFKKIRVRERELEHRLEIQKLDSQSMAGSKDKMILELKREMDQLNSDFESMKQRHQELFAQHKTKIENTAQVVRALRVALSLLEGEQENEAPILLKKAK